MATPLLLPCSHTPQYSPHVSLMKTRNDRNLYSSINTNTTFHLGSKSNSVLPIDLCENDRSSPYPSRSSSMSPASAFGSPDSTLEFPEKPAFLRRSPSGLIMPSWVNYFLPNPRTRSKRSNARLYKLGNTSHSSASLSRDRKVPEVVIRKSNTSVALVDSNTAAVHTTAIRESKKKSMFRKLTTSKSAVLSSTPAAYIKRSSSSSFDSESSYGEDTLAPLHEKISGCSRCSSTISLRGSRSLKNLSDEMLYCKLCLLEIPITQMYQLRDCQCRFCRPCLVAYLEVLINDGGGYLITCPDADCSCDGEFTREDIDLLCPPEIVKKYNKNKEETDIFLDRRKAWCIKPNCGTLVEMTEPRVMNRASMAVCPTCQTVFCASCQNPMHIREICVESPGCGDSDIENGLKRCPRCSVYIERDSGCAQMQCKLCKHVFCWYCLLSLEDDFLLRHYDKGPCKNKLGHSRASVLWHRAQVVLIFASFGVLLVAASPLLLFVGPCLVCRRCCDWCVFKHRVRT